MGEENAFARMGLVRAGDGDLGVVDVLVVGCEVCAVLVDGVGDCWGGFVSWAGFLGFSFSSSSCDGVVVWFWKKGTYVM